MVMDALEDGSLARTSQSLTMLRNLANTPLDDLEDVAPSQLSRQRRDNRLVGERLGEAHHVEELGPTETRTVPRREVLRELRHDLFAIGARAS